MKLELADEYYEFGNAVGECLDAKWSNHHLRAYWDAGEIEQRALWSDLAGLGLFSLTAPAGAGGEQLPAVSIIPALEAAARRCVPHPIGETVGVVIPTLAGRAAGASAEWLEGLVSGTLMASVQDGWSGRAPWGADVDLVLVFDQHNESEVFVCSAAPIASGVASVDPSRRLAQVTPDLVIERLSAPGLGTRARARAITTTSVSLTAAGLGAVDHAVEYAKVRRQFGQVIGSFQAIKHMLANAYMAVESRRRYGWFALSAVDRGRADMAECVSIAKMSIGEAAQEAAYAALQVHGGIGYTWEHDLHFWLKRIQVLNNWLGTPAEHARMLAALYRTDFQGGLTA